MRLCTVLAVVLVLAAGASQAARILGIIPTPSISHQTPFRLIALELARRGHQVTVVTTDPIREKIVNYTEIDVSVTYDFWRATYDFNSLSDSVPHDMLRLLPHMGQRICEIQLDSPEMKDFIRSAPSFDVVIVERLMYQCYYGLVHKVGSPPLIGFVSLTAPSPLHVMQGNPNNPAYCPDMSLPYNDHMSFWERMYNAYIMGLFLHLWNYVIMPDQERIMRKYFGPDAPSVYEMERNCSLLLINNHYSMNYPRPLLPNIVELTGLHLEKQRRPLPKDIQKFLDEAEDGVIYFSLGSNVRGSAIPEEKRLAFLEAFAQLPQRVLWKWEAGSMPGQPDNVMTAKWWPQQDVLAHKNMRLFITQGGLQSVNEAGYFGVPMIAIPFMGDQKHNVAKIVQAGIGYRLMFKDVSVESVLKAVRTVLGDKRYQENMRQFSAVFREHQETSLDRAVWWVEYVLRHRGAPHLRSAALDLHWWQLWLLDVIAFAVIVPTAGPYLLYRAARYVTTRRATLKKKPH
ncbi:UDP-glycosyltransferase UGT5-like isoform X1 [Schistocerca serialis cubense]|uniref:UDP-glycosyltransferase UGT5-like isoform X1 n=1 Tax=Schistocerca serialis cubense TaxID=2023355 RepID=UPI00214F15CB|nr:UDP-glycosyltransferase UGT5-like isoform X1 [Schistocerca serialis cubense]